MKSDRARMCERERKAGGSVGKKTQNISLRMFPMELLKEGRRANSYATDGVGLFSESWLAMTGGGATRASEEEGGSRSPRLFITNVTSRWDLAMPHPGRYLFPPVERARGGGW